MDFSPHTPAEERAMLDTIGVREVQELTAHLPLGAPPALDRVPPGLAELDLVRQIQMLSCTNEGTETRLSYLGAGAYEHFIPAAIEPLISRGEFLTAYTPYQPEASQGTLQATYEFQSLICELMAMDVANASLYEGASALAEAALVALRTTGRRELVIPRALHPDYRAVLRTYLQWGGATLREAPCPQGTMSLQELATLVTDRTAAVIVQQPNFLGCLEEVAAIEGITHRQGALLITSVNPLSLGLLKPPGEYGADIAVAEGQSLGLPLGFGGPYLGLFTCREALLRKVPGRLVGMTQDLDGRRGFVLTLQAREQHIRREKASSNICTNEALMALAATVYLSLLGPEGLREVAWQNVAKSHYAAQRLGQIPGCRLRFSAPFFNEFVLETPVAADTLQQRLLKEGIISGLPLSRWDPTLTHASLWCVTETKRREDIDRTVDLLTRTCKVGREVNEKCTTEPPSP